MPKSTSFTDGLDSVLSVTNTFSNDRSRCTTPNSCKCRTASKSWRMMGRNMLSRSTPDDGPRLIHKNKSPGVCLGGPTSVGDQRGGWRKNVPNSPDIPKGREVDLTELGVGDAVEPNCSATSPGVQHSPPSWSRSGQLWSNSG